jgi:hypothetical protein
MKVLLLWSGLPFAEATPGTGVHPNPQTQNNTESLNRINTRARTSVKKKEVLESDQIFVTWDFHCVKSGSTIAPLVLSLAFLMAATLQSAATDSSTDCMPNRGR